VSFCPTGGINAANARDYLKLPNVVTIGGSWMAPKKLIEAKDWAVIETLARQAAGLRG
jgi:2-dehydro-3-deoxyphosphogluconate aldolase/(4S)-4-hydroxy-2-oxoglutarate aldolase